MNSLHKKKGREEYDAFVLEGVKLLSEAVKSGARLNKVFCLDLRVLEEFGNYEFEAETISSKEMSRISALSSPSPILAIVKKEKPQLVWSQLLTKKFVVLDSIRDPGNLGTIIRTCDWFGITDIVVSEDTVDAFNGKVIQSTMGSFFRIKVHYVDLATFFSSVKEKDSSFSVYGAVLGGDTLKKTLEKDSDSGCLVIGSESHGISPTVLDYCTDKITISGSGNAESLNAAISASIILYEWCT